MREKGTQFDLTPLPEGMSAYHGSAHGFAPGDKIDATPDETHMRGESAAFGSVFPEATAYFGLKNAENQGRLFSSVYEVGPQSPDFQLHPAQQKEYDIRKKYDEPKGYRVEKPENKMPIDRSGFEVKRHHAFAFPDLNQDGNEIIQETP